MVRLVAYLLRHSNLSLKDRLTLTNAIQDVLFVNNDIITVDPQGNLMVNGSYLTAEEAKLLRESAKATLNSSARKLIINTVTQEATEMAFHNGDTPEKMFFGRAAIWFRQHEDIWLKLLAGETATLAD